MADDEYLPNLLISSVMDQFKMTDELKTIDFLVDLRKNSVQIFNQLMILFIKKYPDYHQYDKTIGEYIPN
jgi:hypothetical protein